MNGFWGGAGILLGIAFFFAFANVASRMAQGVPRPRAYFNALIAAAAFGLFSYFTYTGYHTVDADPLTGGNGEIVEDDPPDHPTSKLDSAIKGFRYRPWLLLLRSLQVRSHQKTRGIPGPWHLN